MKVCIIQPEYSVDYNRSDELFNTYIDYLKKYMNEQLKINFHDADMYNYVREGNDISFELITIVFCTILPQLSITKTCRLLIVGIC